MSRSLEFPNTPVLDPTPVKSLANYKSNLMSSWWFFKPIRMVRQWVQQHTSWTTGTKIFELSGSILFEWRERDPPSFGGQIIQSDWGADTEYSLPTENINIWGCSWAKDSLRERGFSPFVHLGMKLKTFPGGVPPASRGWQSKNHEIFMNNALILFRERLYGNRNNSQAFFFLSPARKNLQITDQAGER